MIFDIGFKSQIDRKKFEKKYSLKKKDILVSEESNSLGFGAWAMMRDPFVDIIYYMGFMGYADPRLVLRECIKEKINIIFLAYIPINDKGSRWKKLRGEW